ncbi:MAG: hypothetical protein KGO49_04835 [Gammaproteobacteria bacterium]|nr:hypothetical protein [Gammaproteobacteria bacterium]
MKKLFLINVLIICGCSTTKILTPPNYQTVTVKPTSILVIGAFPDLKRSEFTESTACNLFQNIPCIKSRGKLNKKAYFSFGIISTLDLEDKERLIKYDADLGLMALYPKLGVSHILLISSLPPSYQSQTNHETIEQSGEMISYNHFYEKTNDGYLYPVTDSREKIRVAVLDTKNWNVIWTGAVASDIDIHNNFEKLINESIKSLDQLKIFQ